MTRTNSAQLRDDTFYLLKSSAPVTTCSSQEGGRKLEADKPQPRTLPFLEEQVKNNLKLRGVSSDTMPVTQLKT